MKENANGGILFIWGDLARVCLLCERGLVGGVQRETPTGWTLIPCVSCVIVVLAVGWAKIPRA